VPLVQADLRPDRLPLLSVVAAGTLFGWSVLVPGLSKDLADQPSSSDPSFSGSLVAFAVAVLFGGTAVDRHGSRRVMAVGGLLSAGGIALGRQQGTCWSSISASGVSLV
jgi:MFS family permease